MIQSVCRFLCAEKSKVFASWLFKGFCCVYRFLFILLGPKGKAKSYHEIGRAIATLMSDEVGTHYPINTSKLTLFSFFLNTKYFI